MLSSDRETAEQVIAAAFASADLERAATLILETYGQEIFRFLAMRTRGRAQAEDAFADFCESMWRGLPEFRWGATARTWAYVLARNVATRYGVSARRAARAQAFDAAGELARIAAGIRTSTPLYHKSEVQRRMRELRETLREDQQTLLLLRVDRGLSWRELAVVMGDAPTDASEVELERASARVRSRFQTAKRQLRELAVEAGLI